MLKLHLLKCLVQVYTGWLARLVWRLQQLNNAAMRLGYEEGLRLSGMDVFIPLLGITITATSTTVYTRIEYKS